MKRFGLKNRIFNDNNVEELRQPIDYQYIDQIIEKEKVRVHDFLDSAMKEISVLPKEIEREKKHIPWFTATQTKGVKQSKNGKPVIHIRKR